MNNSPTHVVTGRARLSYTHLFSPYANPNGGEAKYSTTILIPKSDTATKARIDAAIEAAKRGGVALKWNGVMPPIVAIPVHDGDGVRPSDGMPFGDECKGCWVFTASSKNAPQIVDTGMNPIIDQTAVYSGIYACVSVGFFPYANSGKKGVGCGLGNVQKLDDGEPLGSKTTAADDFGEMLAPTPAPYYGVPQVPPQPQYQPQPQPNYAPAQPQINPITGLPIPTQPPIMGL